MKPTSIIFLILSIILIAFGIGLCFVAENMSAAQDIELYSTSVDSDGNNVERYELENADISRISLILKNSNVNIISTSEESYIELVNYSKNTYEFSMNLKTVAIDDTVNLMSILNFAEGGFKFEGLRYFFTPDMYKDRQKAINIYIKEENSLKVIDITLGEGNLLIDSITTRIDYTLNIEQGNVEFNKIKSSTIFDLQVGDGDVKFQDTVVLSCNVSIKNGNFYMNVPNYKNQKYEISTALGQIKFGEEIMGGMFTLDIPIALTKTIVDIGAGDAFIDTYE